ncbi:hypothetical protein DI270_013935 [Microbispora triticiradicis]|uniref:Tetratricopeptide repeat protein n=1 Tax=Microbispora triticiradicis TaxID=2200763 RepID=A0ABX9LKF6_9ACTN|nr:hypothetical protein DI270_013935 [Microbispora triticiradicis]
MTLCGWRRSGGGPRRSRSVRRPSASTASWPRSTGTPICPHAALLGRVGRGVEAVPVGEEAVRLYGELAALNRDAYLPGLAVSLTNQAALLGQVGRGVEAVPASEEAVRLFGELAALNREAYLPDLAGSLQSNALRLAEVGRRAEAVSVNQEALRLFAELAALNREAYLPDLASSLNNHAALLGRVGRGVEAVPVSEEAVSLYGELAALNRDAHLPDALRSLTAWGYVLIENSRFRAAVTPLTAALLAARELPEYVAQSIIGSAADLLRLAYAGDAAAVADEFRVVTGQEVPAWMKEPPSATEG